MPNVDSVLNVLDWEIGLRKTYTVEKERKIHTLKDFFHKSTDMQQNFMLCNRLFDEYKYYQYDSAYVYANHSLEIAEEMQQAEYGPWPNVICCSAIHSSAFSKKRPK